MLAGSRVKTTDNRLIIFTFVTCHTKQFPSSAEYRIPRLILIFIIVTIILRMLHKSDDTILFHPIDPLSSLLMLVDYQTVRDRQSVTIAPTQFDLPQITQSLKERERIKIRTYSKNASKRQFSTIYDSIFATSMKIIIS